MSGPSPDPPTYASPPAAEVLIDEALVHELLLTQQPDLAHLELRAVDAGWDNAMVRVGGELVVRLPRRASAVALLAHELRLLAELASLELPLAVPAPVRLGVPGSGYPWPWCVVRWVDGVAHAHAEPFDVAAERRAAATLGAFLRSIHRPAPRDAPRNPWRGMAFAERMPITEGHLHRLGPELDPWRAAVDTILADAAAARPWSGRLPWIHGDVHPLNVVVRDSHLVAVVDFGDCGAGDPATDLAAAWMLFDDPGARAVLRDASGTDAATWRRARGWAAAHALAHLVGGGAVDAHRRIGERTLDRLTREMSA